MPNLNGCLSKFNKPSVGDLYPVEVATLNIFRVATKDGARPTKNIRSRPQLNDRVEIVWFTNEIRVVPRSKMLCYSHQTVYHGNYSKKFQGRDLQNFLGRDRLQVAIQKNSTVLNFLNGRVEFFRVKTDSWS